MSIVNILIHHWDDVITIGGLVAGALHLRGKKTTTDDLKKTVEKLTKPALVRLLKDPRLHDDVYVRRVINGAIWAGLDRLGVKKSTALQKLVDVAVEHAASELFDMVWKQGFHTIGKSLDSAAAKLETVPG